MDCYRPLRIRNQYTGKWLHVNCRSCPACLVKSANIKAVELSTSLRQYKYKYLITLTYTNDYVPYIYEDMDGIIFRGQGENTEQIDSFEELIDWSIDYAKLKRHCYEKAIGVLYYDDLQRFFKRFRKYIKKHYGERNFKYFAIGEYGSSSARPHYHIVIMSDELLFKECFDASVECWKMHDWDRFWKDSGKQVNEACKQCTESCASYVSSYVNSAAHNIPISLYKVFRQKTVRSKNIAFGLDAQVLEKYKEDVVRVAHGNGYEGNRRVFYYWRSKDDGSISLRLVPSRYIYTFFHKFKGWSEMAYFAKLSCSFNIAGNCEKAIKEGRCLNTLGFKSDDLSFYRAFVRFRKWFGNMCVADYLNLMIKVLDAYRSNQIRCQMEEYPIVGEQNYKLSLIDTEVENFEKKKMFLRTHGVKLSLLRGNHMFCPPVVRNRLDLMVHKYRKRLLPKHLNDMNNLLIKF